MKAEWKFCSLAAQLSRSDFIMYVIVVQVAIYSSTLLGLTRLRVACKACHSSFVAAVEFVATCRYSDSRQGSEALPFAHLTDANLTQTRMRTTAVGISLHLVCRSRSAKNSLDQRNKVVCKCQLSVESFMPTVIGCSNATRSSFHPEWSHDMQ